MPKPSLKAQLVDPEESAKAARRRINAASTDTVPAISAFGSDYGGISWGEGGAKLTDDSPAPARRANREDIPAPEESEGTQGQAGGGGMMGTRSFAPAHQRAYTPEELHAMADRMMQQMGQEADIGQGQAERRFAGTAQRGDYNALGNGSAPQGPSWLDEYMAK